MPERREVFIQSPAKVNLFLSVTGRRSDGYHDIVSLMCGVALYDRIRIRFGGSGLRVTCDQPGVPSDETNLAARAARAFLDAAAIDRFSLWPGIEIHIEKRIPVGAGLGGGSSNAATVLKALNREAGNPLTQQHLHRLCVGIGADVPFFIECRPAIASGVGERLEPIDRIPAMEALVVYPGFAVSTADVYRRLNLTLTKCQNKIKKFLLKNERFSARAHLCNDLETVAIGDHPAIGTVKTALISAGAEGALMSGSGSAAFGLFRTADSARKARSRLAGHHTEWEIFQAPLIVA
ncbi:MAG: 4-(cytidine 5'-diphospho)-2-C-methyl-D-erythritol kinase [Desulfobacterales bacterium]